MFRKIYSLYLNANIINSEIKQQKHSMIQYNQVQQLMAFVFILKMCSPYSFTGNSWSMQTENHTFVITIFKLQQKLGHIFIQKNVIFQSNINTNIRVKSIIKLIIFPVSQSCFKSVTDRFSAVILLRKLRIEIRCLDWKLLLF